MQRSDIIAVTVALAAHVGMAYGLSRVPPPAPRKNSVVEFDIAKPKPKPPEVKPVTPPPEPVKPEPPPPKPPKVVHVKTPPPPQAPPVPNQTPPKEPPKEPVKPVFGVTMDSTVEGDATMSVPVGNTTMIDPKKSGKGPAVPLPVAPAAPPPKPSYAPVSDMYIKTMPDVDEEACAKAAPYPAEAEQEGIEGDVKLRIELDDKGNVHGVRVLKGLGHGLDEVAKYAILHKCKFSPAIGTDNKPQPYVIPSYTFHFEIPR